ncbi:MAG: hypothetical protein IKJ67_08535 [Bacteroidales bacterium]|nr:hypothetical protein [Bacteroidales bacterium]
MAFRAIADLVKRPNLLHTSNRHDECPRCMAWVVLMCVWVLGRPFKA